MYKNIEGDSCRVATSIISYLGLKIDLYLFLDTEINRYPISITGEARVTYYHSDPTHKSIHYSCYYLFTPTTDSL